MIRHGWPYEFRQQPWDELLRRYEPVSHRPEYAHFPAIIRSIIDSDVADQLGGLTSMFDLVVTSAPPSAPPVGVIRVHAPSGLRGVVPGMVVIEHESTTGHDDLVERPISDAVALFWRFTIEKFGVQPHEV